MNLIKEYRGKRGLTQKQLAERTDVSLKYIQSIEQNIRKPGTILLVKIFNILKIPMSKIEIFLRDYTTK